MTNFNLLNFKDLKPLIFSNGGFWKTLECLLPFADFFENNKNSFIPLRKFYLSLNEKSYYKAFYRVKDEMERIGFIKINKDKREIRLAEAGTNFLHILNLLQEKVFLLKGDTDDG